MPPKSVTLSQVLEELSAKKLFSEQSVSILKATPDRHVKPTEVPFTEMDPVYVAIVIDCSPSMGPYRSAVIQSQNSLLDVLRGSRHCKNEALLVAQYLFAETLRQLNPFTPLSVDGSDDVPKLSEDNYIEESYTAIYDAVFQVLQDMATNVQYTRSKFMAATFDIAIITDGEDNRSTMAPDKVKFLIDEMRSKGYLRKAIAVGLTGTDFPESSVVEIKDKLGFDEALTGNRSESEIRNIFDVLSRSLAVRK